MEQMLPFWKKLTREQQDRLSASVKEVQYKKGDILHAGGEDCSGLFLVEEGQLRSYMLSKDGKEITLYRLFERDICIFSASCIMKNITFEVFAAAEVDTRVLLLPSKVYEQLQKEFLAVSEYTSGLLASRMSDVMWVMEQVVFMSFDKRLALFLLEQAVIEGTDTISITQEAIARHLGSAREVVSRMLKYFSEEGMTAVSRGSVQLLDKERLNQLATVS